MNRKITKVKFDLKGQPKVKITDNQIKVLKEVCSDAELFGEFLAKMCWFIRHTTNANRFRSEFGIDDTPENKKLRGVLSYRSE